MKNHLKKGLDIGNLKVASLLSLGHQLEAILYFIGHELGSVIKVDPVKDVTKIPKGLKEVTSEYNLGKIQIMDNSEDIIQLRLKGHSSSKDLMDKGIKSQGSFCSFEAGLLAGIVERMSNIHCYAQELSCSLQSGEDFCEFMIVFQKD